jgi:hypothetical protein
MASVRPRCLLALAALGLGSCGTTLGAVPLTKPGRASAVVTLDAGRDVRFWSDIDATYDGRLGARYDVELAQDGVPVASAVCDAFYLGAKRMCTVNILVGSTRRTSCWMHCWARVPKSGPTEVRAALTFYGSGGGVQLNRASLIIKQ